MQKGQTDHATAPKDGGNGELDRTKNTTLIREFMRASKPHLARAALGGSIPFLEVVRWLIETGVEYHQIEWLPGGSVQKLQMNSTPTML